MDTRTLKMVASTLLIVGGVNWGLVGLMDLNIVETVLGTMPEVVKIVYILVGAAAVYTAVAKK